MSPFDIIIIVAVSVAFVAVVGVIIYKKVTHKGGGCDCGCGGCSHSCGCCGDKSDKKDGPAEENK